MIKIHVLRSKELKIAAKIADRVDKHARYDTNFMKFCNDGSVESTDGRLLSILFNAFEHDPLNENPEDIYIKIPSKDINSKLEWINIEGNLAKSNNGGVFEVRYSHQVTFPPIEKITPNYLSQHLYPAARMGSLTEWIRLEPFEFGLWYTVGEKPVDQNSPAILDTKDNNWLIVGMPCRLDEDNPQGNCHSMLKLALYHFKRNDQVTIAA